MNTLNKVSLLTCAVLIVVFAVTHEYIYFILALAGLSQAVNYETEEEEESKKRIKKIKLAVAK